MTTDDRDEQKRNARRAQRRTAAILRHWDPSGVEPGVAGPADEYDGYAPLLVGLVAEGATVEELAQRLRDLRMGMLDGAPDDARDAEIAREIVATVRTPPPPRTGARKRPLASERDEGSYRCPSCGEAIVVPLDPSEGDEQRYVEDCPVCCNPNVIHVEFFGEDEAPRVWAEAE